MLTPVRSLVPLLLLHAAFLLPAAAEPVQQLDGINAEAGQTYVLGEGLQWAFTLNAANFTISPVRVGDHLTDCGRTQKILRIDFTIQNASSTAVQSLNHTAFTFTAVDAKNASHDDNNRWGLAESREPISLKLKPAQTIQGYATIVTDASGPVPKLIVQPQTGLVLRYDLRELVQGFRAPFADPEDATNASVLPVKDVDEFDRPVPLRSFALNLHGFETLAEKFDRHVPKAGHHFLIARASITNLSPLPNRLAMSAFDAQVVAGNRKFPAVGQLYRPGDPTPVVYSMPADDTEEFLFLFEVPIELNDARVQFSQKTDGHVFTWAVP
ncbi:MAG: hypothetical protein GEEBNDBF_00704 [bacterium]|nr:hypothetical protein [bacterium]